MSEDNNAAPRTAPSGGANALGVPIAIVIAAALIAGAIIFTGSKGNTPTPTPVGTGTGNEQVTPEIEVAPVTKEDHILGNPNAPIVIVEYSDFDCPFCKSFHETMNKIMDEYGNSGKVAWVFRQLPLEQLHPNAPKTAAASECVAALGGNDAFWKFANSIYEDRATNDPANIAKLPEYAVSAGVNKEQYLECVTSGKYTEKIAASVEAGFKTGARGTPYSILIVGNQQGVINGAQPYATVKAMIDKVLVQIGDTEATQ